MAKEGLTEADIDRIRDEIHQYTIDIGKVLKGLYNKLGLKINESDLEFVVSHTVVINTMINSLVDLVGQLEKVKKKKELSDYGSKIDITEILKTFINNEYNSKLKN